jgi:hypothetical protein
MHNKIKEMAVFIEFLVGSGLAMFFHMVLHNTDAAYMIFGIGVLLALATYLVREEIGATRKRLAEQYHQAHEIPFAIARITDPECQARAHEIMGRVKRTIALLQEGYIPLDESEFYLECARLSDQATHRIKAVDPLTPGWGTRGTLRNFYQANLRALDRGVKITRIFVLNREDLQDQEVQKMLCAQYGDNVDVRIAYRDEIPTASDISGRDTNTSCDFAIYDDRVATDVFIQPGRYFGKKTGQPAEVAKYLHIYELIEHCAHAVTEEGGRIVPAAATLQAAA